MEITLDNREIGPILKIIHTQMKLEDTQRVQMNRAYCERIDRAGAHEAWADAVEHYPQTKENQ